MPNKQIWEKITYVSPDGEKFELVNPPRRYVLDLVGAGQVPVEYQQVKGPYQHGVYALAYRLEPRVITMLVREQTSCREDFWAAFDRMHSVLTPARTNPNNPEFGYLEFLRYDGEIRRIDAAITRGADYSYGMDEWDEFAIQQRLDFFCPNPIFYDPQMYELEVTFSTNVEESIVVPYAGTWPEYPVIEWDEFSDYLHIIHEDTGDEIQYDESVSFGATLVFDLREGIKSVTSSVDGDVISNLDVENSDLATFSLLPHPRVANGLNTITFSAFGISSANKGRIKYFHRYGSI